MHHVSIGSAPGRASRPVSTCSEDVAFNSDRQDGGSDAFYTLDVSHLSPFEEPQVRIFRNLTLIPGMTPSFSRHFTKGVPSAWFWYRVSS